LSNELSACGQAAGELRSWSESRTGLAGCSVIAGLKYLAETLRITLSPATRERSIIIDENVRAVRYWPAFEQGVHEYEELAILITRRIKVFFVSTAELPVVEERVAVTICGGIRLQSIRQERR